jgi:Fe-S oxidoreductase
MIRMGGGAELSDTLERRIRDTLKDCHGCGMCFQPGSYIPFREDGLDPDQGTPTPKCPPSTRYKFISYSARGRLWLTAAHFYESLPVTEDIVKVSYTCQTCGLCDELCFMSKVPAFRLLREEIAGQDLAPAMNQKAE